MELFMNRTSADVARAKELNNKVYSAWSAMSAVQTSDMLIDPLELIESTLTDAEFAEWKAGLKGAYNYTDLNRVESAVRDLSDILELGLITKTNWNMSDVPTKADMERYISNLEAIKTGFSSNVPLPSSMSGITYISANNIEKMLTDAFERIKTHDVWEKKPASVEYDWLYTKDNSHASIGTTGTDTRMSFYGGMIPASTSLIFNERTGFAAREFNVALNEAPGKYIVVSGGCVAREIQRAWSTGNTDGDMYEIQYNYTIVGYSTRAMHAYCSVAGSLLSCVALEKGTLPPGDLIEGSYDLGYCYVKDGDDYFYYVRR